MNYFFKLVIFGVFLLPYNSFGQETNLIKFLSTGKEDGSLLLKAYLNPLVEGLSYGMNGGWYHTAKAHKGFGLDIGISVNAVFIPTGKYFFDPLDLGLQTMTKFSSTSPNGLAPTVMGPDVVTTYQVTVDTNQDGNPDQVLSFEGPGGVDMKNNIGMSAVPVPILQIGLGLFNKTDIKIRYTPNHQYGQSKIQLLGVGIMHDIKQHIGGIKYYSFDMSLFAGYSRIDGITGLEGKFNKPLDDPRKQQLQYFTEAWVAQILASKKIKFVTFYGGLGYNAIFTKAEVQGGYVVASNTLVGDWVLTDPIAVGFKNFSPRITGGLRFQLGALYIFGDYTFQEYQTVSVGMGLTVK